MENCSICNSDYKKAFKSDHLKSVKYLENLNQNYCKKFNNFMPLSDKSNHLSSDQFKNQTKQQHIWCEDCGKYISDKTRHFQSKINKAHAASYTDSQLLPGFDVETLPGVEVIVNEKTYIKLRVNPTGTASENLEHHIKNY